MASRKGRATRKLRFGNSVSEELGRVRDNEFCSIDEEPVGEPDNDEEEETDFEEFSSEEEWEPESEPTTKKQRLLFLSPTSTPYTPKTPTSCSGVSLSPWSTPKGRSHSPQVRKRSARGRSVESDTGSWNDISVEDEAPVLPNFHPKRTPGPQVVMDRIYSPLQLFQLFFPTSVIDTIVTNTNSYAKMRSEAGVKFPWVPLKAHEMYSFIALVIYMGLLGAKNIVDYWSRKDIYCLPFPKSVMSRSRFNAITWNLHLCDLKEDRANALKKGTPDHDRLFKIKPLYTDIINACKTYFHPNRQLSVDERMVATRARIGFKQYMKDKPTKWGYKLFVLADSACAYTWNFFVYEGKSKLATGKGMSYDSVIRLLDFPLLGKGYQVFMDNFYTSPGLLLDLLDKKTLACGTIRSHQQGFPRTMTNDLSLRAQKGSMRWLRKGKLLFVRWMDSRAVSMCSTMHKAYDGATVTRRVRNPKREWEIREIPIPAATKDYNKYMGGVDVSDALIGYYNVLHKTKKWYKTFFFHFIDIAVVNSFILHQQLSKSQNKSHLTQKEFRETLVSELVRIGTLSNSSAAPKTSTSCDPEPSKSCDPEPSTSCDPEPSTSNPYTTKVDSTKQTCWPEYYGSDATIGRRICVFCKLSGLKVKTPVYCSKCSVALCFVPTRNCFRKWHDEKHGEK
ncbi:piggyBac transposable element-derived protein 4-like [Rhinichthys klamathensis goyatoka]|uniref:piggyBac transposable element-derived protein 4-like n=1 Tax=Rhinichthys klamathensis goyatoka TaxID=3034132 RepID=UPI0024B54063|nr:piggyBac transposable element-derived protein 4-like [Rhinichthys klamathensis goyatoka]